jgi:hypothetical protein
MQQSLVPSPIRAMKMNPRLPTRQCLGVLGVTTFMFALGSVRTRAQEGETRNFNTQSTVTIADGTSVQLRFAQSLRGLVRRAFGRIETNARVDDRIRLVCGRNIKVNGLVVIPKGAVAQATVTGVWLPNQKDPEPQTGLDIQLDWVKDVTGENIPLRAQQSGAAKPFTLEVRSMKGGLVARPYSFKRGLIERGTFKLLFTVWRAQTWAPAGTRITGYVQGNAIVDAEKVQSAQTFLPVPNPSAVLMIYRTRGNEDHKPNVKCDDKEASALGAQELLVIELSAGTHNCRLDNQKPVNLTVESGEMYYLHLRYRGISDTWELQQVSQQEGEDSVAKLQ